MYTTSLVLVNVTASQGIVGSVTAEYNREQLWLAHEPVIVQLQARVRGYLVKKAYTGRMEYLNQQEASVIRLQVSVTFVVNVELSPPYLPHVAFKVS